MTEMTKKFLAALVLVVLVAVLALIVSLRAGVQNGPQPQPTTITLEGGVTPAPSALL